MSDENGHFLNFDNELERIAQQMLLLSDCETMEEYLADLIIEDFERAKARADSIPRRIVRSFVNEIKEVSQTYNLPR